MARYHVTYINLALASLECDDWRNRHVGQLAIQIWQASVERQPSVVCVGALDVAMAARDDRYGWLQRLVVPGR